MKLVWSERAIQRLDEEAAYIGRSNGRAARSWLLDLADRVGRLREFPFSGRTLPEFPRLPVREVIVDQYRVVYLVEPDQVVIVTVKHSRQRMRRKDVVLKALK